MIDFRDVDRVERLLRRQMPDERGGVRQIARRMLKRHRVFDAKGRDVTVAAIYRAELERIMVRRLFLERLPRAVGRELDENEIRELAHGREVARFITTSLRRWGYQ